MNVDKCEIKEMELILGKYSYAGGSPSIKIQPIISFLQEHQDENIMLPQYHKIIHRALCRGHISILKELLKMEKFNLSKMDLKHPQLRSHFLRLATDSFSYKYLYNILLILKEQDINFTKYINQQDEQGNTFLHLIANNNIHKKTRFSHSEKKKHFPLNFGEHKEEEEGFFIKTISLILQSDDKPFLYENNRRHNPISEFFKENNLEGRLRVLLIKELFKHSSNEKISNLLTKELKAMLIDDKEKNELLFLLECQK